MLLVSCGGGGGSSASNTGRFADSAVQGLEYTTTPGGNSGATSANGAYSFTAGDTVTFSLGDITLGSAIAIESTLFPKDIADGASGVKTAKIAQLLQSLDADNNPDNGIDVSHLNRETLATKNSQIESVLADDAVDFVQQDITDLSSTATLVTRASATAHATETLQCEYAGGYKGRVNSSSDNRTINASTANFGTIVHADGTIQAIIQDDDESIEITGKSAAIDFTKNILSVIVPETGVTNTITFSDVNNFSGTSVYSDGQGGQTTDSFTASRIGGGINAKYRFTGLFSGSSYGLFTFDIDSDSGITGLAYSVSEDQPFNVTGSVSNTALIAQIDGQGTITATINLDNGTLSGGTWESDGSSGTFVGNGCTLN